jgi:23S rRNA (guanosine2251-2'-O)-methyltransferase
MPKPNKQLYLIAHNIRSLHNVGSLFRTADSLGVSKIYLTGYTGSPPDPKIAKVALGAENFVPWEKVQSITRLIKRLRSQQPKLRIVALENNLSRQTINLAKYKPRFPLALIIGEETKGLTKSILNLVDDIVEIPMRGRKESLNVSVAAGIAVYQILR